MADQRQLIVIANRLPVRRPQQQERGGWTLSPGGLVSALRPVLQRCDGVWLGWTGQTGPAPAPFEHDGIDMIPVPVNRREAEQYYWGFSNRTLWPLYHDAIRWPEYHREWWHDYVKVNQRFADAAAEAAGEGALVWIHDFHLQLVPRLLRERRTDLRIGFFLHVPFPPAELFAQLPWRKEILEGILGADVIGFQTSLAAANFRNLARRYTKARLSDGQLAIDDRTVIVDAFPISVDFDCLDALARDDKSHSIALRHRARLGMDRRILLGVDRLDYTKGIDLRLKAFSELLAEGRLNPNEVMLLQVAVPSREEVADYKKIRAQVEQLVGGINGQFGRIGKSAVNYLHRSLPHEQLVPLYAIADVMLVTPMRDGMNLVAKEYVACRSKSDGVLVLSEFTGAAQELHGALLVNPHDVEGVKEAMVSGLTMSREEQRRRMRNLRRIVRKHDVYAWSSSFLSRLQA